MLKLLCGAAAALTLIASAGAQTKISGAITCGKPDINHAVPVGDSKTHVILLQQTKCTWSKPIEMEGLQTKDDLGTGTADVHGTTSQDRGYDVTTMSNGDKVYVRSQGTSKLKGEMLDSGEGKWSFSGGTGKFKSLTGGGTFKLTGNADGSVTVNIEGQYTMK
ncbi:MAG TPA: hypothetical protein VKU01_29395 [Bryobacteraceae bacterium]|nr:hypothetical protein [Bryobacteraceae bacterium]